MIRFISFQCFLDYTPYSLGFSSLILRVSFLHMRKALLGKSRKIEPFPFSPFPSRNGGTKSEKSMLKINSSRKRAKNPIFEDLAHI